MTENVSIYFLNQIQYDKWRLWLIEDNAILLKKSEWRRPEYSGYGQN